MKDEECIKLDYFTSTKKSCKLKKIKMQLNLWSQRVLHGRTFSRQSSNSLGSHLPRTELHAAENSEVINDTLSLLTLLRAGKRDREQTDTEMEGWAQRERKR